MSSAEESEIKWFDDLHPVDDEWVELSVTGEDGREMLFLVPRRTLFRNIDEATAESG